MTSDPITIEFKGMDSDNGKLYVRVRDEKGTKLFEKPIMVNQGRSIIKIPSKGINQLGVEVYHDENYCRCTKCYPL